MGGSFQAFRFLGVPVRIHLSWLLIFFLVAWSLARGYLPGNFPGWSARTYWLLGFAGSSGLFLSVLVHEFSHSLVAISRGYKVKSITLFILGGVSEIETEANKASEEFLISVIGPVTSFVLAGLFFGASLLVGSDGNPQAHALARYLSTINLALGAFNMIPGFPMDGGRVLRAIIWKATGSLQKATSVASSVGSILGMLFIAGGVLIAFNNVLMGIWLAFIGWFIQSSASQAKNQHLIQYSLEGRKVREAMVDTFPVVTPGTTLQDLIDNYVMKDFHRAFAVKLGDQFYGLVTVSDIRQVETERRRVTPVTEVMTRPPKLITVQPDSPLEEAFHKLAGNRVHQLMVMEDGKPVGMITREGVMTALELTGLFRSSNGR